MKICIINGNPDKSDEVFVGYMSYLVPLLRKSHHVEDWTLRDMNLHFCTGCWNCWWKTPGICSIKDDFHYIARSCIQSNIVLFASPLIAGFPSSNLKGVTDRLVSLLHPYIKLIRGECHHEKRYINYPDFGLLLKKESDTDLQDLKIVRDIYHRLGLNFHADVLFVKFMDEFSPKALFNDITNSKRFAKAEEKQF
jgi:hypothetical protein